MAVRRCLSTQAQPRATANVDVWDGEPLIDSSRCTDALVQRSDLRVLENVITEQEELVLAKECETLLRRRRYEENHWDQVIIKFKEMERSRWSPGKHMDHRQGRRRSTDCVSLQRPPRSWRSCAKRRSCHKDWSISLLFTSSIWRRMATSSPTWTLSRWAGDRHCNSNGC